MEILAAAILGVIQGLTEFLPISSSAHLILAPWFLGWAPKGLVFDVFLHIGTAISVVAFFWSDWIHIAKEMIAGFIERNPLGNDLRKLGWQLALGTLPAMVLGLAFEDVIETKLRSPLYTVFTLAVFGALLYIADKKSKQSRSIEQYGWADAIWIGLSQTIAMIPGVSRSGITITTALFRNSSRTSAARFSFLLSTPVIVGAGLLKSWHLFKAIRNPGPEAMHIEWIVLAIGIVFASITGFLCIRYFLRFLQTKSLTPFVIYRFLLAGAVLFYFLKA